MHDTLLVIRNGIFDKYLAGAQRTFPMSVSFLRLHSILFFSIETIDNISHWAVFLTGTLSIAWLNNKHY